MEIKQCGDTLLYLQNSGGHVNKYAGRFTLNSELGLGMVVKGQSINTEEEQFIASQRIRNMPLNDGCMSNSHVYFSSPT